MINLKLIKHIYFFFLTNKNEEGRENKNIFLLILLIKDEDTKFLNIL